MQNRLVERFIKYAKIHTTSDPDSNTTPSTSNQFVLANIVKAELEAMKLNDIILDENCYLTATLPSNCQREVPVVGFCAHFDTSPSFSGENVNPIIRQNYDGNDIVLSDEVTMKVADFPFLKELKGHDLITTDGSTLLGSDDKAGIAEIVELINYLVDHPEIEHGEIKVLFTPDEEIGRGTDKVNLENFKVDFAYTLDGGQVGELEYENFNAASLVVETHGRSIHPGSAKNKMVNAQKIAMEFHAKLPAAEVPELTEKYEGFYHLDRMSGDVEHVVMHYIIRDHDMAKFEAKKSYVDELVASIQSQYGPKAITYQLNDSYYNMKEKIEPIKEIVDYVKQAMERVAIRPIVNPIRGGTDGARLSYMGVPTPNICTGGYNFHGRFELNSVQGMEKTVEILRELIQIITNC